MSGVESDLSANSKLDVIEYLRVQNEIRDGNTNDVLRLQPTVDGEHHPYVVKNGRTYLKTKPKTKPKTKSDAKAEPKADSVSHTESKTDSDWVELANFTARILSRAVYIGMDREPEFVIEAIVSGKTATVVASFREFQSGDWVLRLLGPNAIVKPGYQTQPHFRAAVQHLSGLIPDELHYCHTGWAKIDDRWRYLHAGGCISDTGYRLKDAELTQADFSKLLADEPLESRWTEWTVSESDIGNLKSHLPESLARFDLTSPLEGAALREGVRSVLRLLEVAPLRIMAPLFGAIFRAPLSAMNSTIHFVAPPQNLKTAMVAVAQQFFGASMDAEHLPGHWSGTANSLESLSNTLKDSLFVVDDFAPSGSEADVRRLHRDAERLIRSAANHSGRTRATSTGEVRAAKPPRGLMISTGEDIPEGKSLRLRMLNVAINPGDISTDALAECQKYANSGVYARMMASYLTWLAPQYGSRLTEWAEDREQWKDHELPDTIKRRTYFACKELELGYYEFLRFAAEVLNADFVDLQQLLYDGLMETAMLQATLVSSSDPVDKFLATLRSAFLLGKANLEDRTSNSHPEESPQLWGWKKVTIRTDSKLGDGSPETPAPEKESETIWQRQGQCIGWADHNYLFIDADAASTVLFPLAAQGRNPISITMQMLERQLADRGVINRDLKRKRIRKRLTVNGTIRYVLEMPMASLLWLSKRGPDIEEQEENERDPNWLDG